MAPRFLVHLLGLCNVVAGALLFFSPARLVPLPGANTDAATLLARSQGVVLAAIGVGAWLTPRAATRGYLWIFGVAVKALGAALWTWAAIASAAPGLWTGASLDALVAMVVTIGLRKR